MRRTGTAGALTLALTTAACAGPIEKACVEAGRSGATAERCGCVQRVADSTLERSEQRLAATFFEEPHRAQEVRQSDRPFHEAFWPRYKRFGTAAERSCR